MNRYPLMLGRLTFYCDMFGHSL